MAGNIFKIVKQSYSHRLYIMYDIAVYIMYMLFAYGTR